MIQSIIHIAYLLSAILFVWGLKLLSSPETARKGNMTAAYGMGLAIITAVLEPIQGAHNNYIWIIVGIIFGSLIGLRAAKRVKMTAMPELVSIFNGLGGACAVLLAIIEINLSDSRDTIGNLVILSTLIIGAVSFTGSILAYLKLAGKVRDKNVTFNGIQVLNLVLLFILIGLIIAYIAVPSLQSIGFKILIVVLGLVYGFTFVAPIGGADMPVVISLLNSLTGISAALAGLIYGSNIMILGGILVGASGTILTIVMCEAMNRSLLSVVIGNFGGSSSVNTEGGDEVVKEISVSDLAVQMYYSKQVMLVPGYGLAVAQAQKLCQELESILIKNGVEFNYAIHPVAGRMPGHMNVLLAEANVNYEKLISLEEANERMKDVDLAIVVGANDVVNPMAIDSPGSPIFGMPVIEVWNAKNVVIMKRSMSQGYAGIQNPLFFKENSKMLFGDAKNSLQKILTEIKNM